ncbi:MAG TPA: hypothetical protein VHL58_07840 [Thermoanaerobaculia bacterium]|nr:hypothetical protein [Thermoanaerobaculia bacterium]
MLNAGSESQPGEVRTFPLLILAAHLVTGFAFLSPGWIRPDSVAVYSWLRSLLFDRDLLFFNEWSGYGMIGNGFAWFKEITPTGALANHWWIGTSLLSAPFYCAALAMKRLFSVPGDGFSGIYPATLGWSSVLFACGALVAAERVQAGLKIEPKARLFSLAAVWVGTPLFWYEYRFPLGTHAAGALTVGALTWLLWKASTDESNLIDGALIGLVLGLCIATRLQHFVLALPVLYVIWKRGLRRLVPAITAGATLPLAIQATAWQIVYGHPLGPLVRGSNLEGVTWMPFRTVAVAPVLFSSFHGLFIWSPVVALAVIGWFAAPREHRLLAMVLLLMFLGELVANSAFDRYWWGGMSFGARRFTDLAAPFAIGLALLLSGRWRRIVYLLTSLSIGWSTLLIAAAISGHLSLEHDVAPSTLLRVALRNGFHVSGLHSALTESSLRLFYPLVLLLVLGVGAPICSLLRRPRILISVSVAYLTLALLFVASSASLTLQRAPGDQRRFGLSPSTSAIGPLLDQRKLIAEEVVYLQRREQHDAVAERAREIGAIDRRLASLGAP